ncbi:MAG: helix-turn-helix transcriptional regulator [Oscillospiraceae bacterium]|nr:helix-turn-helix transcriptional regulator [Oscillospiraceae bacterium]
MKDAICIKNDDQIAIGSNIKRIRLQKGIKAAQLIRQVNLLGIDLNTFSLSKIEADTQHIKASQFKAIMKVLDCSAEELLKEKA